jgi:3'(2'), 5'-bisphosphate nucleotidase
MLDALIAIAQESGKAILSVYKGDPETVRKADGSPLTVADRVSHRIVAQSLAQLAPELPVFSEEGMAVEYETRRTWKQYFLVDPLDGTKGFLEQNGEFTVNIAVIRNGRPALGVVHHPVSGATYAAEAGSGAVRIEGGSQVRLSEKQTGRTGLRVLLSRNDKSTVLEDMLQRLGKPEAERMHSAIKFCLLADGSADLYLRMQPSMEWDAAAGHLIVEEAGGRLLQFGGNPLVYNRADLLNPSFLAFARSFPEKVPNWRDFLISPAP